jgi:hypothetical protein
MTMTHLRRASRDPLKGAALVARQSRFHGAPASSPSALELPQ